MPLCFVVLYMKCVLVHLVSVSLACGCECSVLVGEDLAYMGLLFVGLVQEFSGEFPSRSLSLGFGGGGGEGISSTD